MVDPDESYAYIGDGFNCVVRRLDLSTQEVEAFAGEAEFCDGVDGPIGSARFGLIIGMAIDEAGDYLYVSDRGNDAIRRIDLSSEEVDTIAGQMGSSGAEDGAGEDALLNSPGGIAIDSTGDYLYVADMSNDLIRRVALYDDYQTVTVAGQSYDPPLDELSNGAGEDATFSTPQTVIRRGEDLYVFGFSNALRRITKDGDDYEVETVAGAFGAGGFVDGSTDEARFGVGFAGVAVPGEPKLLLGDLTNDAIRKVNIDEGTVETLVGAEPGLVGDEEGRGIEARFDSPAGVVANDEGTVTYIADAGNHVIRYWDRETGSTGLVAGLPGGEGMADGFFDGARFSSPRALALSDDETTLVVADTGNSAIRKVSLANGEVTTMIGDDMESPLDLAMHGQDLFVTDVALQVVWHYDGSELEVLAGGQDDEEADPDGVGDEALFAEPVGIAVDPAGDTLYVTDGSEFGGPEHQALRAVDIASAEVSTVFGMNPGGVGDQDEVEPFESASLRLAEHLEVNETGDRIIIADSWHNAIRAVDLEGESVTTVIGQVGVGGAENSVEVALDEARLERPVGITMVDEYTWQMTFDNALYEARLEGGQ